MIEAQRDQAMADASTLRPSHSQLSRSGNSSQRPSGDLVSSKSSRSAPRSPPYIGSPPKSATPIQHVVSSPRRSNKRAPTDPTNAPSPKVQIPDRVSSNSVPGADSPEKRSPPYAEPTPRMAYDIDRAVEERYSHDFEMVREKTASDKSGPLSNRFTPKIPSNRSTPKIPSPRISPKASPEASLSNQHGKQNNSSNQSKPQVIDQDSPAKSINESSRSDPRQSTDTARSQSIPRPSADVASRPSTERVSADLQSSARISTDLSARVSADRVSLPNTISSPRESNDAPMKSINESQAQHDAFPIEPKISNDTDSQRISFEAVAVAETRPTDSIGKKSTESLGPALSGGSDPTVRESIGRQSTDSLARKSTESLPSKKSDSNGDKPTGEKNVAHMERRMSADKRQNSSHSGKSGHSVQISPTPPHGISPRISGETIPRGPTSPRISGESMPTPRNSQGRGLRRSVSEDLTNNPKTPRISTDSMRQSISTPDTSGHNRLQEQIFEMGPFGDWRKNVLYKERMIHIKGKGICPAYFVSQKADESDPRADAEYLEHVVVVHEVSRIAVSLKKDVRELRKLLAQERMESEQENKSAMPHQLVDDADLCFTPLSGSQRGSLGSALRRSNTTDGSAVQHQQTFDGASLAAATHGSLRTTVHSVSNQGNSLSDTASQIDHIVEYVKSSLKRLMQLRNGQEGASKIRQTQMFYTSNLPVVVIKLLTVLRSMHIADVGPRSVIILGFDLLRELVGMSTPRILREAHDIMNLLKSEIKKPVTHNNVHIHQVVVSMLCSIALREECRDELSVIPGVAEYLEIMYDFVEKTRTAAVAGGGKESIATSDITDREGVDMISVQIFLTLLFASNMRTEHSEWDPFQGGKFRFQVKQLVYLFGKLVQQGEGWYEWYFCNTVEPLWILSKHTEMVTYLLDSPEIPAYLFHVLNTIAHQENYPLVDKSMSLYCKLIKADPKNYELGPLWKPMADLCFAKRLSWIHHVPTFIPLCKLLALHLPVGSEPRESSQSISAGGSQTEDNPTNNPVIGSKNPLIMLRALEHQTDRRKASIQSSLHSPHSQISK